MGMFDYVYFKCPKCKEIAEEQSKAGDCDLKRYFIGDIGYEIPISKDEYGDVEEVIPAPLEILAEASKYGLDCRKCGNHTRLAVNVSSIVYLPPNDD